jgi:hypothetical protein
MNRFDQVVRITAGCGMIYLGFIETSIIDDSLYNLLVGAFGIVNLIVGMVRVCPVYFAIGLSTVNQKKD